MRRPAAARLAALVLLAAGWALTLWVTPWNDERVNDLFVYRSFTDPVLSGDLPYRDFAFEYPPLAIPAIAVPGLAGTGEEAFRWAFATWTLAGGAAIVLLCGALAERVGASRTRAMAAAALMPVFLGALVRTHFDVFPVVLLLAGLLLVCRERPRAGLAVLGLGAMTKVFPLVAVPVVVAWLVATGRRREAWQGSLACAAVIAAIGLAAVAISPDGALDAVRYHFDRPVQIESWPAAVLLGLDAAGAGDATSVSSYRSDGLLHPAADAITWLFLTVLVALVTLLCARLGRRASRATGPWSRGTGLRDAREPPRDTGPRELVIASLAACAGFALLGKVLSPQYVIWIAPLGALAFACRMQGLAATVALVAVLTQIEFPAHYFDVVAREPAAIALVVTRNLALAAVVVLAVRELRAPNREPARAARAVPV